MSSQCDEEMKCSKQTELIARLLWLSDIYNIKQKVSINKQSRSTHAGEIGQALGNPLS